MVGIIKALLSTVNLPCILVHCIFRASAWHLQFALHAGLKHWLLVSHGVMQGYLDRKQESFVLSKAEGHFRYFMYLSLNRGVFQTFSPENVLPLVSWA